MTIEQIHEMVEIYAQAAENAMKAGFDGVEVHAANGYLLDQFLQSKTNHRDDAYGGSIENRFRLLREVVEGVTAVFGANRVGVRLSPNGVFSDISPEDASRRFIITTSSSLTSSSRAIAVTVSGGRSPSS